MQFPQKCSSVFFLGVFSLMGLFCFSIPAEESKEVKIPSIPEWASSQINETFLRFQEWKGNDEVVVFPLVTDVHSETHRNATANGDPLQIDWSDTKNHVYIAQQAAVVFSADFMVDLGDIGIDRYSDYVPSQPEDLFWRLAAQLRLYQDFTAIPVFFCIGNHDHGPDQFTISSRIYGETFNLPTLRRGIPITTGPNFDYGIYDIPEKRTRVFFLNSSEEGYYGFSKAQLQFLADHLQMSPGWTAVICQHFCVDRSVGVWLSAPHIRANRGEIWTAILKAFLHNEAGSIEGITWNFTQNHDCRLAGCLVGDSHYDNQGNAEGFNNVITQGFGRVLEQNMPKGAVSTPYDPSYETLIDVAVIKPEKRKMKLFRIGAGGLSRDREFSF